MTTLTKTQLLFVATLLDELADELDFRSCNDMPEKWEKIIPNEEWTELAKESLELGVIEKTQPLEEAEAAIRRFDSIAATLFAKKIRKIAEEKE